MLLVVLTVSTLVHIYSTEYMREDPYTARFISYLFLLTLFTMLFIISDNFVGFAACSFFLTRPYSSQRSNLLRLMGTTPDRSAPQKGDSTSLAVPGASSQTSLEVAVPPFSAYKHLLIGRSKHPLLYDKDAKGFLG